MKTTRILLTLLTLLIPFASIAQEQEQTPITVAHKRPAATDTASSQLIKNFLAVTGGQQAHIDLQNVVATGTITIDTINANVSIDPDIFDPIIKEDTMLRQLTAY